jgi:uncharacterized protein YndB with AHSA1/START domain
MRRSQGGPKMVGGRVDFAVPVEVAFAYLADPRHRPEWQSSLRSVELLDDGEPRVGMRWRDHTAARIVPDMEITVMDPGRVWGEVGNWRAFSALLLLTFEPTPTGCAVHVQFRVTAGGLLTPFGWLASVGGVLPVRSDVKNAARILADRGAH